MEPIKNYLDMMFANLPSTPSVLRAKDELFQMMEDKYTELIQEGKSENEAVGSVISEFGNLDELAEALGLEEEVKQQKEKYVDIESFAKHYLINKLVRNADAYRSSFYMYQDGKNDKIHVGPIWDYDLAFYSQVLIASELTKVLNRFQSVIGMYLMTRYINFQRTMSLINRTSEIRL